MRKECDWSEYDKIANDCEWEKELFSEMRLSDMEIKKKIIQERK